MFSLSLIAEKIFTTFLLILILLFSSELKAFARPVISNANDVSFTVTWISSAPATGEIRYGHKPSLGNTAYDVRGFPLLSLYAPLIMMTFTRSKMI